MGHLSMKINQSYKDLVFIWHPDRIPKDNQRLLEKATAKLQEINHAREQLRQIHQNSPKRSNSPLKLKNSPPTPIKLLPPISLTLANPAKIPKPTVIKPIVNKPTVNKHTSHSQNNHQVHNQAAWRPHYRDLNGADLQGANLKEKISQSQSHRGRFKPCRLKR
jgi:hypothetical protein